MSKKNTKKIISKKPSNSDSVFISHEKYEQHLKEFIRKKAAEHNIKLKKAS